VAQTNEAEAVRLLGWRGSVLAATGNMGKIYKLGVDRRAGHLRISGIRCGYGSAVGQAALADGRRHSLDADSLGTARDRTGHGAIGQRRCGMAVERRSPARMRGICSLKRHSQGRGGDRECERGVFTAEQSTGDSFDHSGDESGRPDNNGEAERCLGEFGCDSVQRHGHRHGGLDTCFVYRDRDTNAVEGDEPTTGDRLVGG